MRRVAFWLSLILIFMIPWENAVTVAGLGTLTRVTGLLVAAVWVGTVLVTGRFREPRPFHLAVYLFVLWNVVSTFWSFGIEDTVQSIKTYLQLLGLTLILWDLYTTPAALRAGLQAYVFGAHVAVGSTVFNYFAGKEAFAYSGGRYTGSGLNANDLALILALGLPVAWHLAVSAGDDMKNYILRLANYAYIPAALFAMLLTASRMALLTSVPAFLFVLGTSTRLKFSSRVLIFAALVGALFAVQSHIPSSSLDRLATTSASIAERDLGGRVGVWRAGIAAFLEHPLLGVGSGAFGAAGESGASAHNTFLSVLVEVGIVGFALFAIVLVMTVYHVVRQTECDSGLWLTVLLVWAIGASALTWEYRKPTWLFLSLMAVGASLSGQGAGLIPRGEFPVAPSGLPDSSAAWRDPSTYPHSFFEPRSQWRG